MRVEPTHRLFEEKTVVDGGGRSPSSSDDVALNDLVGEPVNKNYPRSQRDSNSGARFRPGGFVGRKVGHYIVRELMGRGGMASVYRAEHRVLGREVALKILHAEYTTEDTMVNRFVHEARSMAAIEHPGILGIQDIGRTRDGDFYMVMELLKGETLGERLDEIDKLSEARALKLIRQVACALAVAHDHGVIHRDIKPDNVFLIPDSEVPGGERVKVFDFGIAKSTGIVADELTGVGIVIGTPAYMAPEQCSPNARVDGRADIYGLGGLMYRMVTGQKPFTSTNEFELLRSHRFEIPRTPIEVGASISLGLEAVIMRCLAKDPADRFQSMYELAEQLAELESKVEISGPMSAPYLEQPFSPALAERKTTPMDIPRVPGTLESFDPAQSFDSGPIPSIDASGPFPSIDASGPFPSIDSSGPFPSIDSGSLWQDSRQSSIPPDAIFALFEEERREMPAVEIDLADLEDDALARSRVYRIMLPAMGGLALAGLVIALTALLGSF